MNSLYFHKCFPDILIIYSALQINQYMSSHYDNRKCCILRIFLLRVSYLNVFPNTSPYFSIRIFKSLVFSGVQIINLCLFINVSSYLIISVDVGSIILLKLESNRNKRPESKVQDPKFDNDVDILRERKKDICELLNYMQ